LFNDNNLFTVKFSDYAKNHYFGKGDLPKNTGEQAFIERTLTKEFRDYISLVR